MVKVEAKSNEIMDLFEGILKYSKDLDYNFAKNCDADSSTVTGYY